VRHLLRTPVVCRWRVDGSVSCFNYVTAMVMQRHLQSMAIMLLRLHAHVHHAHIH
jgi:hypothetical protein